MTGAASTPRPGRPARGSRSGKPLMVLFDLLGRRWALRVLWELRDGGVGFRELRSRCDGMSSSVLRVRLDELVTAGLVATDDSGHYRLSEFGSTLLDQLRPLSRWAEHWGGGEYKSPLSGWGDPDLGARPPW